MSGIVDTFVAPVCEQKIEILYQDSHLLLINKPSGLLSLSGKNPLNKDSVHFRLVAQFSSALMVHRLDLGTSGIMVLALTKTVNGALTKQFQERRVAKTYVGILDGHLELDEGIIDIPLAKDPPNFPLQKVCLATGKTAQSHYKVLARLDDPPRTRVLFEPLTGRTHQLRIHSRELGHAILGCDLYGSGRTRQMATRLLLHALTLDFVHPLTGESITGQAPCAF